tara:strand:- start:6299 stop:7021 length:723 start_codon:yes stop_codon:yes gene_type:complete
MRWPNFSRRETIGLIVFAALMLVAFLPLRVALGAAGVSKGTIAARQVRGSLWWGRIDSLTLGGVHLGDVDAKVSPVQLLVGRIRLDLWRKEGLPNDFAGAWSVGFNQRGIDDVTGMLGAGGVFAPLPLSTFEFEDVTVHFAGDTCAKAEGRLRVRISGQYAGLNLAQGMSGAVTCDGAAVLVPLVSQTGMERLSLRIWRDGRTSAQLAVKASEGANIAALTAAGLTQRGEDYVLTIEGQM